jgi:hypothetical protein
VPKASAKWVTANVVDDAASVIAMVFDEAERCDPGHRRRWVALVDGNNHQIERTEAEAQARGIDNLGARLGTRRLADAVREVTAGIRRRATAQGRSKNQRVEADVCARSLVNKAVYLDHPPVLAQGWPIASGVIEGTRQYLVANRVDIAGARWSVEGAEAVLELRAVLPATTLRTTGDSISQENRAESTRFAMPTRRSRSLRDVTLGEPHHMNQS